MHLNPDSGFDRVASFYDPLARLVFGSSLQDAQNWLLTFIPKDSTILIIGGGSGWILEQILQYTSPKHILYLEASAAMLQKARNRNHGKAQVEFRLGTDASLRADEQFNVIITPFILDLFPPNRLSQLMHRLNQVLAPKGLWLFTDFWPIHQKLPFWQKLLKRSMYLFFGFLSKVQAKQLPDYQRHFDELSLQELHTCSFYKGFIQSKVFRKSIVL